MANMYTVTWKSRETREASFLHHLMYTSSTGSLCSVEWASFSPSLTVYCNCNSIGTRLVGIAVETVIEKTPCIFMTSLLPVLILTTANGL